MIPWVIITVLVAEAAVGLTLFLAWGAGRSDARAATRDVLKAQLKDIEETAAPGALAPEDARIPPQAIKRRGTWFAFAAVAAVALGGAILYATFGSPDLAGGKASGSGEAGFANHPGGDVSAMIGQLEGQLKAEPNNAQGWAMLGWSYFETRRYPEAAKAYARAADLDPSNAETQSALGESLVRAKDGLVGPDADNAFRGALALDPGDPRARYFLAVEKDQKGDHQGAMDDWTALLRSAPPDAPWAEEIRAFVLKLAASRGEDISSRLPPARGGPDNRGFPSSGR